MIRFEWRWPSRRGTLAFLLALLLLLSNLSSGQTTQAATTCCGIQTTYGGLFIVRQTGSIYYNARTPGWVSVQWLNCSWDGLVQVHVTWCGAYRYSASQIDVGYNYTKAITVFGIGVTQSCWSRRMYWSGGDVGSQRQGC